MIKLERRAQWRQVMAALRVHARLPDAAQILFGGTPRVPRHKIAKTTPCKVEWAPGSQHSGRLRPGQEMVRRHGPA